VIRISDRLVIKPSFKEYNQARDEIVLTIDPKMSFGTGEHQTTKLVLQILEKHVKPGMKVLDVGSGTGILSIAAIKLGAAYAVAVDSDEICYSNCKENCERNRIQNSIEIITGEITDVKENDFDIIFANIHKEVLLEISGEIKKLLRPDKLVILSGLLIQDFDETVTHYSDAGFKLIEKQTIDEWIALAFKFRKS
jgi:ribosomal protein L11 methyltransferase